MCSCMYPKGHTTNTACGSSGQMPVLQRKAEHAKVSFKFPGKEQFLIYKSLVRHKAGTQDCSRRILGMNNELTIPSPHAALKKQFTGLLQIC